MLEGYEKELLDKIALGIGDYLKEKSDENEKKLVHAVLDAFYHIAEVPLKSWVHETYPHAIGLYDD